MSFEQSRQWDDGSGSTGQPTQAEQPNLSPRAQKPPAPPPFWQQGQLIDGQAGAAPANRWPPAANQSRPPRPSFDGQFNPAAPTFFQSRSPWNDPFAGRRPFMSTPPDLAHDSSSVSTTSAYSVQTPPTSYHQRQRPPQPFSPWDGQQAQYKPFFEDTSNPMSPASDTPYDPFAPPQARTFAEQPTFSQRSPRQHRLSHDNLPAPDRRLIDGPPARKRSDPQSNISTALVQDVRQQSAGLSPFEVHLQSEMNRRNIANKTINTIRSAQAKAIAQSKEEARRAEWLKNAYIKFPVESASSDSPFLTESQSEGSAYRPAFTQPDPSDYRPSF